MKDNSGEGKSSTAGRSGTVFAIVTLMNAVLVVALLVHSGGADRWGFLAPRATADSQEAQGAGGGAWGRR